MHFLDVALCVHDLNIRVHEDVLARKVLASVVFLTLALTALENETLKVSLRQFLCKLEPHGSVLDEGEDLRLVLEFLGRES